MRTKILTLFATLLFIPQYLWATVHSVPYNASTVLNLQDNDEISLVGFPTGWVYSRVVLGINSVPALQLSGSLVANDCLHELHGYYDEVAFVYTGNETIVYHGPAQNLPIHWWVDAAPVVSTCKSYSEMLRRDSVFAMQYSLADSVFSEQTRDYKDLGELNSVTFFEGTSSNFKIVNLPDWFYNRIFVQVEPVDGRELNGRAFANGADTELKGYSLQFALDQKTHLGPTFELAFPEFRKVKLKWWAEVQTPNSEIVEAKEKQLTSDSVEVEYSFEDDFGSKKSVKIVYDKRKFSDGKPPVIKKMSFNPYGLKNSKIFGVRGDVYEIDANVNPGDSVVVAIPIGDNYQPGKDSIMLESYDEVEGRWVEQPVDSIVDGYAYSSLPQLARWRSWITFGPLCLTGLCDAVESIEDLVWGKTVGKGLKWVHRKINDFVCGNENNKQKFDPFKQFTLTLSERPDWDPEQGTVDVGSLIEYGQESGQNIIKVLDDKRKKASLVKLSDPYPDGECHKVDVCRNSPFALAPYTEECKRMEEICRWNRTRENLDVLLADAILSQFNLNDEKTPKDLGGPVYKFEYKDNQGVLTDLRNPNITYNYDEYFMVSSGLVEKSAEFVENVKNCADAVNYTGRAIQNCIDWYEGIKDADWDKVCNAMFGVLENNFTWGGNVLTCEDFLSKYEDLLDGHEDKLIAVSEAMVRISLLAWLKKGDEFRYYTLLRYRTAYDGVLAWLELVGAIMDYNNVSIKAYGSLALYEYIHYGSDENLKMLNGSLNRHYGDHGGFSEGTGYSQYIWDDVPYVLAALKDAYKKQKEPEKFIINEKFLKSPDYMFEFSRPVGGVGSDENYGLIPVEVDDGVTYNPDYRVWAKLKNDPKYLAMSEKYPLKSSDGKINPLVVFGFPNASLYNSNGKVVPDRGFLWGDFKDGIGMITAVNGDDTVALSMIAENGKMWTRGQAHDQQDNLSITLTSSKKGFLIQDPGYSGFGARSKTDGFHKYTDHNVLTTAYTSTRPWGQNDNKTIPFSELRSRVYDLTGDFPGFGLSVLMGGFELFSSFDKNYSVEGGDAATVLDRKINEPQNEVIGFTATTKINKPSTMGQYDNNRTIMYFGGNFWVIDRPTNTDDMFWTWRANSPKDEWKKLQDVGLNLYGSWDGKLILSRTPENDDEILQNGSRSDFIIGNDGRYYLRNYKYTATETRTKTYVMTYSLGDETFTMDRTYCPITAYQCFVNSTQNMRVIVPPSGTKFRLCGVLPNNECSGEVYSTGVTMLAKTTLGEWTTHWVLDGNLTAVEKGVEFPITAVTVSRTDYYYDSPNGPPVNGKYSSPYLPALPILLLR